MSFRTRTAIALAACLLIGPGLTPSASAATASTRDVVAAPTVAPAPAATPRSKKVYVIADSVGLSARNAIPAAFPAGWEVPLDGFPGVFVEQLDANQVRAAPDDRFGDYAVVAAGYNYPYWDPARFDRSVDDMIASLEARGTKQIFWVTLREVKPQFISASAWKGIQPYYFYFPEVNDHLRSAVGRHSNLTLVDWAAIADRPGLTYDAIHLNTTGAKEYSDLMARIVTGSVGRLADGTVTEVAVAGVGGVPPDAAAVALNLAVTDARTAGYLTAYPCGEAVPLAANLNYRADTVVSAAAVVPVGAGGKVCVYNSAATQLVVDVMGSFPATGSFTREGPTRLTDTRNSGGAVTGGQELRVAVPGAGSTTGAVVLNVTAIGGPAAGFVTVYRCGDPVPATSNVNFGAGSITPNLVVVKPDVDGRVCVRPNQTADLVVDLFGVLDAASVALPGPTRALDTRATATKPTAGSTTRVSTAATGAAAVFVNVTATEPVAGGFVTTFPCGAIPPTANLNVAAGQTVGNFSVIAPDAAGDICIFSNVSTHLVVDVLGSMTSGFSGLAVPARAFDSRTALPAG